MSIADSYRTVVEELASECRKAGRDPRDVRLVSVSKTVGVDGVRQAIEAGAKDFGENRPDQLLLKSQAFPTVRWHFIGNIQSRRIPDIVGNAALIHSVFTLRHARKIGEIASRNGFDQDILIEVNISGEASKSGADPQEARDMVLECAQLPGVRVRGLMTMAPRGDATVARECFDGLADLKAQIRSDLTDSDRAVFDQLSMGMSEDWREAVAAGATLVRIGRAIFSDEFQEG